MARRPTATVTFTVNHWPVDGNCERVVDRVNKRTATRIAKRLGLGSFIVKNTMPRTDEKMTTWRRQTLANQPAAPRLKNGRKMDVLSYFHHYTGSKKYQDDLIVPLSEVA